MTRKSMPHKSMPHKRLENVLTLDNCCVKEKLFLQQLRLGMEVCMAFRAVCSYLHLFAVGFSQNMCWF